MSVALIVAFSKVILRPSVQSCQMRMWPPSLEEDKKRASAAASCECWGKEDNGCCCSRTTTRRRQGTIDFSHRSLPLPHVRSLRPSQTLFCFYSPFISPAFGKVNKFPNCQMARAIFQKVNKDRSQNQNKNWRPKLVLILS
jgi:hypothetical protein